MNLENAIRKGDTSLVRSLVAKKKLAAGSHSLLELALTHAKFDVLELLLEHCALDDDSSSSESSGPINTLLHYAASLMRNGSSDGEFEQKVESVTRLLLTKYNLSVTAVNEKNETPIHVAAKCGNLHVCDIFADKLMKNPSNTKLKNLVDKDGFSLFHALCMGRNSNYVAAFLSRVPSVSISQAVSANSAWCPGYNALHFAAAYYRHETFNLLAERAMSDDALSVKTAKNLSALHLACQMNDPDWLFREMSVDLVISRGLEGWLSSFCNNLEVALKNRLDMVTTLLDGLEADARRREISISLRFAKRNDCSEKFVAFARKQIPRMYEVSEYFEKMMVFDDDEALNEILEHSKVLTKARSALVKLLTKYQSKSDDFDL